MFKDKGEHAQLNAITAPFKGLQQSMTNVPVVPDDPACSVARLISPLDQAKLDPIGGRQPEFPPPSRHDQTSEDGRQPKADQHLVTFQPRESMQVGRSPAFRTTGPQSHNQVKAVIRATRNDKLGHLVLCCKLGSTAPLNRTPTCSTAGACSSFLYQERSPGNQHVRDMSRARIPTQVYPFFLLLRGRRT